jgi:KAP family P-loop domain
LFDRLADRAQFSALPESGDDAFKKMASAGAESIADEAADEAAKFATEQPTFMQRFDAISKAIKQAGRNVLVIIDDVDRLHGDELLGVMKAVRLLGRFDRVHYLLSYDDSTGPGCFRRHGLGSQQSGPGTAISRENNPVPIRLAAYPDSPASVGAGDSTCEGR